MPLSDFMPLGKAKVLKDTKPEEKNTRIPFVVWESTYKRRRFRLVVRYEAFLFEVSQSEDAMGNPVWRKLSGLEDIRDQEVSHLLIAMGETLEKNFKQGMVRVEK